MDLPGDWVDPGLKAGAKREGKERLANLTALARAVHQARPFGAGCAMCRWYDLVVGSAPFSIAVGRFVISCVPDGLPLAYDDLKRHAQLVDEFDVDESGLSTLLVSLANDAWPMLVVAQSCSSAGAGFYPCAILVEETNILLYGVGERLLAYSLDSPTLLWEDRANFGIWGWARHGDVVVMSAELELTAFSLSGAKLWTTFVEPPWTYRVEGGEIELDVMGVISRFPLRSGPAAPAGGTPSSGRPYR